MKIAVQRSGSVAGATSSAFASVGDAVCLVIKSFFSEERNVGRCERLLRIEFQTCRSEIAGGLEAGGRQAGERSRKDLLLFDVLEVMGMFLSEAGWGAIT